MPKKSKPVDLREGSLVPLYVASQGHVVLSDELMARLGVSVGDHLHLTMKGEWVILLTPPDVERMLGDAFKL